MAFSPDGKQLAAGAYDGAALLWSMPDGKLLQTLIPASRPAENYPGEYSLSHVRFSAGGDQLLTASYDGSARLWNLATGALKTTMQNRPLINTLRPFVADALFSPDGSLIATGSSDGVVRLWDARTGEREADLRGLLDFVMQLAFSPDGSRVAAASFDGTARVWDVVSGSATAVLAGHAGYVSTIAFDPTGQRLATGSQDATVRVWEAATGTIATTLGAVSQAGLAAAFAPDGDVIVADTNTAVTVYDPATGSPRAPASSFDPGRFVAWWRAAISPDGRLVAFSDLAKPNVLIWNLATGSAEPELVGHKDTVQNMAWSPDGRLLATPSEDMTVRVWDVASGKTLHTLTFDQKMAAAAFSPDGHVLAVAGANGVLELWDATTWTKLRELRLRTAPNFYTVAFNADGSRLVSGNGNNTADVWDVATGALLTELRGHTTPVVALAFSPDGHQVIGGDQSGEVRVWDVASGQTLATMRDVSSEIRSVAMSPTGHTLLVLAYYGPARLTSCDVCGTVDDLLAVAEARGTRELTPEERRRYLGETAATPVASPIASPVATPVASPAATPIG
jgi:WD40 repeat protein